jgi:hypothetical protein
MNTALQEILLAVRCCGHCGVILYSPFLKDVTEASCLACTLLRLALQPEQAVKPP